MEIYISKSLNDMCHQPRILIMSDPTIIEEDKDKTWIECTLKHSTEKALLVEGLESTEHWIPLSQIDVTDWFDDDDPDQRIKFLIPTWLMLKKDKLC